MIAPTAMTTTEGAALPLVALPQTELLTVDSETADWLAESLAPGVKIKPLRLDIEAGVWVILVSFAPGSSVPLHYHTGEAEVLTLSGRWHYAEHADQPQTAGSYLYEPAGSIHTLTVPEENVILPVGKGLQGSLMAIDIARVSIAAGCCGLMASALDTALADIRALDTVTEIGNVLRQALRELVARKAMVIRAWIEGGQMAPVDPYHLFFTIWAATQTYADFEAQVCAVLGVSQLDADDFEHATEHLVALLLRGCGLQEPEPVSA